MRFVKKIWILVFTIVTFFSFFNVGYCMKVPKEFERTSFSWSSTPAVDYEVLSGRIDEGAHKFTDHLEWVLIPYEETEYEDKLWYITSLIQIAINWLLWILAFVALVYMLYCGFLVFSSGADDKNATKGKKWISTAAIALAWIGLSWLIISAMIRFINLISSN